MWEKPLGDLGPCWVVTGKEVAPSELPLCCPSQRPSGQPHRGGGFLLLRCGGHSRWITQGLKCRGLVALGTVGGLRGAPSVRKAVRPAPRAELENEKEKPFS